MIKCNGHVVELDGAEVMLVMEASLMLNSLEKAIPGALDKIFFILQLMATETTNKHICKWLKENIKNDINP